MRLSLLKMRLIYFRRNVNSRIKKSDEENADQNAKKELCSQVKGAKAKAQEGAEFLIDGKTEHSRRATTALPGANYPTDFVLFYRRLPRFKKLTFCFITRINLGNTFISYLS